MKRQFAKASRALYIVQTEGFGAFLKRLRSRLIKNKYDGLTGSMELEVGHAARTPLLRKLSLPTLTRILERRLQGHGLILALSQDDYTKNVGGVQLRIMDEQIAVNDHGVNYLHVYPCVPKNILVFDEGPFIVGARLDGKAIGFADGDVFLTALKSVAGKRLGEIRMHHTMGYSYEFLARLLQQTTAQKVRFWLHDFFSICPSYYLLRNNVEYCHAPAIDSNSCHICVYHDVRRRQQEAFHQLFKNHAMDVVAPSEFALALWQDRFPSKTHPGTVRAHAELISTERLEGAEPGKLLRIGFIGHPVFHKGWPVWLRLTDALGQDPRFRFYLFSSNSGRDGNFRQVRVSVTHEDRSKMVRTLEANRIDVAFLWSICPETFSFTLYESLAADCYVVTSKDSGNIQDYLTRNPGHGLILQSEEELLAVFSSGEITARVSSYKKASRPKPELVFNAADQLQDAAPRAIAETRHS